MRTTFLTALALLAGTGFAQAGVRESCDALWEERNAIYKDAGYCFKTPRAIRRFGNAGCRYDDVRDVPLSQNQRTLVGSLESDERMLGCAR